MRTAYIHIGTEKTGSTSIQSLLKENGAVLAERGYRIADIQCPVNHMDFVAYCIDRYPTAQQKALLNILNINDPIQHLNWKAKFKSKVDQKLTKIQPDNNLILTSEHFHSRLKNVDEITSLKELLSPYYSQFKVIVYLRRQDELALSLFNEALKSGGTADNPLHAGHSPNSQFYDYLNLVETWASVFGKDHISARLFEPDQLRNQSLYSDFLAEIGITNTNELSEPEIANKALSGYKQHLLLFLNKLTSKHGQFNNIYFEVRTQIVDSVLDTKKIEAFEVSNEERKKFLSRFLQHNACLSEAWLNGKNFRSIERIEEKERLTTSRSQPLPSRAELEHLLTAELVYFLNKKKELASKSKGGMEGYRKSIEAVLELTREINPDNTNEILNESSAIHSLT